MAIYRSLRMTAVCAVMMLGLAVTREGAIPSLQEGQRPVLSEEEQRIIWSFGSNDILGTVAGELKRAGVPITEDGLVAALSMKSHENVLAVTLLSALPKNPRIIAALRKAAESDREGLALGAMNALQKYKETGWEDQGIRRLLLFSLSGRISLAGILARAGRSEGWPAILEGVLDRSYRGAALREAPYFHGLSRPEWGSIDVNAELKNLLDLPEVARAEISAALKSIPSDRK